MNEGKIIKYYRENAGITQEELGRGICSVTHISKIELGQTHYSPEIILLLSERLNININQEMNAFKNIKQKLDLLHEAIIMQRIQEADSIIDELERNELIHISDFKILYKLIQVRYHHLHGRIAEAYKIIRQLQKDHSNLPSNEGHLFKHVMGILHICNQEYQKAIEILRTINNNEYKNREYYYHLAISYHADNANLMAYTCAEKALQFFKETNNFLRMIDVQMVILIIHSRDKHHSFKDRIKKYDALIQSCDLCNDPERKAIILHNLALEYFRVKEYTSASKIYKQSMGLKKKGTGRYLLSLEGYIQSCLKSNLLSKGELLTLIQEGLAAAEKMKDPIYMHLFKLPLYLVENQESEYFQYLSDHALPFFKMYGQVFFVERFEKELFDYYANTRKLDKAMAIARNVMNAGS
ncbi:helix-turn-helix protein [Scopulibacillus darangshiensis]|uniref:Helix-turn-helix protein n=1 Tax=Scopulibacillus darangshiensis TaxID=442528 RepID=A0A4R2P4W0_9BACL|nr:helix-turn-helix transcriptional regulator [Scopulibacillus darangshiensis]TCP29218.1 helix-turn-helix protein [Scopulibacillus darangshiensis]